MKKNQRVLCTIGHDINLMTIDIYYAGNIYRDHIDPKFKKNLDSNKLKVPKLTDFTK